MKLAILRGLRGEDDILLDALPFAIGRCKTANLIIPHVNVSRNHCNIIREASLWKVTDYSSSGTFINNNLIGKGLTAVVRAGDKIRFGSVENNLAWTFYPIYPGNFESCENQSVSVNRMVHLCPVSSNDVLAKKNCDANDFYKDDKAKQIERENLLSTKKHVKQDQETKYCIVPVLFENIGENDIDEVESKIVCRRRNLIEKPWTSCPEKTSGSHEKKSELPSVGIIGSDVPFTLKMIRPTSEATKKNRESFNTEIESLKEITLKSMVGTANLTNQMNIDPIKEFKLAFSNGIIRNVSECEKQFFLSQQTTKNFLEELKEVKSALNNLESKNLQLIKEVAELIQVQGKEVASAEKLSNNENVKELVEMELQCTICSELFVSAITLGCSHTFCQFCITLWKKKQKNCPICRKKITVETKSLVLDNYIEKLVGKLSVETQENRSILVKERIDATPRKKCRLQK